MQVLNFKSAFAPGQTPYEIFKDRMSAITSLVDAIKNKILNKYENGLLDTTIEQINKERTQDQTTSLIAKLNEEPTNIYPANLEEITGAFLDSTISRIGASIGKKVGMGLLQQKETMMGNLPTTISPDLTYQPTASEIMIPKGDKAQLLNAVMNMPEGQMDWQPILNYIKEKRPKMMGTFSPMEQWAMEQAMGQNVSPQEKLSESLKLAEQYSDYFAEPEIKTEKYPYTREEVMEFEKFKQSIGMTTKQQDAETYIGMYNRKEITRDELMKLMGGYVEPEKLTDFQKKFNMLIDMKVPMTTDNWLKFFNAYVAPEKSTELKAPSLSDINNFNKMFYGDENNLAIITPDDYTEAVNILKQTNINLPEPEYLKVLEKDLERCLTSDNTIISDEWFDIYKGIYPYYKDALQGASPKYLPPEEIKKVGPIEGAFTSKVAGEYTSALVEDKQGKVKDESGYIVGENYRDAEGKLWKYIGNGKFEEVTETESKLKEIGER
jgi:hypothetical protein